MHGMAGSVASHLGKLCVQRGVGRAGFWARQLGRWSVAWVVWRDGQLGCELAIRVARRAGAGEESLWLLVALHAQRAGTCEEGNQACAGESEPAQGNEPSLVGLLAR